MSVSYSAPTFEPEQVEREINELDDAAREARNRDLYGTDLQADEETPELVQESLELLREELDAIDPLQKEAYTRATDLCPDYTTSLFLTFLRTERFDPRKTARRIVTYWDEKLKLFGEENTFHRVTERDLGDNGRQVLLDGGFQLLPHDEHARAVFHANRGLVGRKKNGRDGILKVVFYLLHVAAEDTQQLVILSASRNDYGVEDYDRIMMKRGYMWMHIGPMRYAGYHIVYSSSFLSFFLPPLLWLMGPEMRSRYVPHYMGRDSSDTARLASSLGWYGLTKLPLCCGGSVGNENEEFLKKRREIEATWEE